MINNNDIQLIEDYIDGLLEGEKLTETEARLKSDQEFKREYEQRKKLAALWVGEAQYQSTKQQVKEIINAEQNSLRMFIRNNYYLFGIAASLILFFGIYWFFIRQNGSNQLTPSNQLAVTTDTALFKQDNPKSYGKIKHFNQLLSPVNNEAISINDSVIFRWKKPINENISAFIIKDSANSTIVFQKNLDAMDTLLIIKPGELIPGTYYWYVNDSLNKNIFTIIETK